MQDFNHDLNYQYLRLILPLAQISDITLYGCSAHAIVNDPDIDVNVCESGHKTDLTKGRSILKK